MTVDWAAIPRVPEPRSARGKETRQQIVLAAADLFAERGVDAVQVAEILERAEQHNASAIQYHFGSREGLIIAVLEPRPDVRGPMDGQREAMLDELLIRRGSATLVEAVECLVRPSLLTLRSHEGRSFIRVAAQVTRDLPVTDRVQPRMSSEPRAMALMAMRMPEMPEPIRDERLAIAFTLLVEVLANRAREIEHGVTPHLDDATFENELVAMTVGLLTAPTAPGR
jgi:TetR/AcrR family transcriptional regulator, regulator of cefoperazone and chloramphenicol sensitivity